MKMKRMAVEELYSLTELFEYHDVGKMVSECTNDIRSRKVDIFVLYDQDVLIGELHAMYENEDEAFAIRGKRAYLFAFRIKESYRNKGYGKYLLKTVLNELEKNGYDEFTVGVEDDNQPAIHLYQAMGFNRFLCRKREAYQGDSYEFNLYLKK